MVRVPDVVALARRSFATTGRIDMNDLAAQAGVNRSTIYRRYRGRDQLLGEVIWSLAETALDQAEREARETGGARIAEVMGRFAAIAMAYRPFAEFLRREPERALRVVTTRAGNVATRIVERLEALVAGEAEAGRLALVLSPHETAFVLLRIAESFVYTDAITGEQPDPSKVQQACGALLGVPQSSGVKE